MNDTDCIESDPMVQASPRPVPPTVWQSIQKTIYNPETKKIFGRTLPGWGQLLIFYCVFYGILAALVAISTHVFFCTLDPTEPKWKLERSLIGTNPGLGFRPISFQEGAVILYNDKNPDKWVKLLDEFFEPYKQHYQKENVQKCNFLKKPKSDFVCWVDSEKFGPCGSNHNYGYNTTSPCVFIKLNKIFGWIPQTYTKPERDMPNGLTKTIKNLPKTQRNQVWISCNGEDPADRENIEGFNYYPLMGLPEYYYPYQNVKNYLSPLVAVRIMKPTPNVLVNIECRAWAKNIIYKGGKLDRQGSVHFEILYEKDN